MHRKKYKKRKILLFLLAGFYFLSSLEFVLLEGLHEISHLISKIEHHHKTNHNQGHENTHHHETIDLISKILNSAAQPQQKKDAVNFVSIDKHISPKAFPFEVFETEIEKQFPWYTFAIYESTSKVIFPPPKVYSLFYT